MVSWLTVKGSTAVPELEEKMQIGHATIEDEIARKEAGLWICCGGVSEPRYREVPP